MNKGIYEYYISYVFHHLDSWYKALVDNGSKQFNFQKYSRKMKYFATVKNDLTKYDYVAIGNWSNNTKVRSSKGPICELKKYLVQNGVRLIEIDEFNTSKTCSQCVERECVNEFKNFQIQSMESYTYENSSKTDNQVSRVEFVETRNVLKCTNTAHCRHTSINKQGK